MNHKRKLVSKNEFNINAIPNAVYYVFAFVMLGVPLLYYCLNDLIPEASGYYSIHYVYTYDHGFVSRGFVGEVLSWFFETISPELTKKVVTAFSVMLMVSAALCVGKVLSKTKYDTEKFKLVCFLMLIVYILPLSLERYYTDIRLDKVVWVISFLSVFLCDRKYAIWFVPVLCVLAMLVSPIFVLTCMILVAIILLQEFYSNGYSVKNGIICGISYASIILCGIYAIVSEKFLGFENAKEMTNYYFSRYTGELSEAVRYRFENVWLVDFFAPIEEVFVTAFNTYFRDYGKNIDTVFTAIFISIPFFCALGLFWKQCIKNEENKFQKLIYFFCMISPVIILPIIIISWETAKYSANSIMANLCLIIYFVVKGNFAVLETIDGLIKKLKDNIIFAVLAVLYLSMFLTFSI